MGGEKRRSTRDWDGADYTPCMRDYVTMNTTIIRNYNALIQESKIKIK